MGAEVCWNGSMWREYQAPPVIPSQLMCSPRSPRRMRVERAPSAACMNRLYAVLTDDWQSRAQVEALVTFSHKTVSVYVRHLLEQGRIERMIEMLGHPRRPTHFYRRVTSLTPKGQL